MKKVKLCLLVAIFCCIVTGCSNDDSSSRLSNSTIDAMLEDYGTSLDDEDYVFRDK